MDKWERARAGDPGEFVRMMKLGLATTIELEKHDAGEGDSGKAAEDNGCS